MPERRPRTTPSGQEGSVRRADQEARLAAELRRNLLRRKQQQRARADRIPSGSDEDTSPAEAEHER